MEEELPKMTHLKVETPPPKETKQSSKPKVKKVTPKTKVTPVPDNEIKYSEKRALTPKPKHKEKINTPQAKSTVKGKPNKQSIAKKSTGPPRGGKALRARGQEALLEVGEGDMDVLILLRCHFTVNLPLENQNTFKKRQHQHQQHCQNL